MTYPAHTSHLFQLLDGLPFGRSTVMKKYRARDQAEPQDVDHPGSLVDEHD
jgi:hypothetical protein